MDLSIRYDDGWFWVMKGKYCVDAFIEEDDAISYMCYLQRNPELV